MTDSMTLEDPFHALYDLPEQAAAAAPPKPRLRQRQEAVIKLAHTNQPISVPALFELARVRAETKISYSTLYKMIHQGRIPLSWIIRNHNFGCKQPSKHRKPAPAEAVQANPFRHLHARVALFEAALTISPDKFIVRQMAREAVDQIDDELAALVRRIASGN